MQHGTSFLKRCIALALALVLLVSNANLGVALQAFAAEEATKNVGEIVADNYDLTNAEKDLLKSGLLVGAADAVEYSKPGDGLIEVDTDAKTITVKEKDGWVATSVKIFVGETEKETAVKNGSVYTYSFDGNAFSVKVTYEYKTEIAADVQNNLLNAAKWLKDDLANLKAVNDQGGNLSAIQLAMPALLELAALQIVNGTMTIQLSEPGKAAIYALNDQMAANDGVLEVNAELNKYAAGAKTEYLVKNGAQMLAAIDELRNQEDGHVYVLQKELSTLVQNIDTFIGFGLVVDQETLDNLAMLEGIVTNLNNGLAAIPATWSSLDKALVVDGANYALLDAMLEAIANVTAVSVKNPLLVDTATVQHNLAMFDVTVNVVLNVVENEVDSDKLVQHGTESVVLTLAENATAAEIQAAIDASGVVADALASWNGVYTAEHYESAVSALPGNLTADITHTITYSPKTYTVSTDYEGDVPVPYGYQMKLDKHSNVEMAYDYYVNGTYFAQGNVVTITGNTTITRTEGRGYTPYNLYDVVADRFGNDIAKEILMSGALKNNEAINVRQPNVNDAENLLDLYSDKLTAQNFDASYAGLSWVPYSYGANGNENVFSGNEAAWTEKNVKVIYRLNLTNYSVAEVKAVLDLAVQLKAEAEGQVNTLDRLAAYYGTIGQLNKAKLGALNGVIAVTDLHADPAKNEALKTYFTNTVGQIIANNLEGNELKIYVNLGEYIGATNGLKYYYDNNAAILAEIESLSGYMSKLLVAGDGFTAEEKLGALEALVSAAGFPEYAENIKNLEEVLAGVKSDLTAPNAVIDLSSKKLGDLTEALASDAKVSYATPATAYLESAALNVADDSMRMIQVTVLVDGAEAVVSTTMERGTIVTKDAVDTLKKSIEGYFTNNGKNPAHYSLKVTGKNLDKLVGEALTENIKTIYEYSAKEYIVKIEGEEDQVVTINDLTVELPKHPNAKFRYEYTIDGVSGIKETSYKFTGDQLINLFVDGTYTITRVEINEANEKFIKTFTEAGWDVKQDAAGNITGLTAKVDANKDGIMAFANVLLNSGYTYIALNNEEMLYMAADNSLEIKIQTVINALLKDENFSSKTLIKLGKDGKGAFLQAKLDLDDGSMDEVKTRSAANPLFDELDFVLYLNSVPAQMGTVAKGLEKMSPYISFQAKDGKMGFDVTIPDAVYDVYLAALLTTGNIKKGNIEEMNSEIAFQFLWDYIETITDEDSVVDTQTFTNTLKQVGVDYDLTGAEEYYQLVKKALSNPGVVINPEDDNKDIDLSITGKSQKAINGLIGMIGIDTSEYETYLGMIYEYKYEDAELSFGASANLTNTENVPEAAVIDVNGNGITNKFQFTDNLAAFAPKIQGPAIVILVSDVDKDLVFNGNNIILDLNGQNVNGSITANGALYIIDSAIVTADSGNVSGKVSGNVTIMGGRFAQDVASFLKEGYEQVAVTRQAGGVVQNELFHIEGTEDHIIYVINSDVIEDVEGYIPNVRALAVEITTDLLLNYFTTAALSGDDNVLYDVDLDDLIGLIKDSDKIDNLINKVLNSVDLPGISGFANSIINDLLDFSKLHDALANDTEFATHKITTAPWDVVVEHNKTGDYLAFGIGSNHELEEERLVSLKLTGSNKDRVLGLLKELGNIVVIDKNNRPTKVTIDLKQPVYDGDKNKLEVNGSASVTVHLDLTKNKNYPVVLAVIVANGGADNSDALVAAVNSGDADALQKAINNVSVEDILSGLKALSRTQNFAAIANKVGVTANVAEAAELENLYHLILCASGKALDELDITGRSSKLSGLDKDNDGTYEYKTEASRKADASARGYSVYAEASASAELIVDLFKQGASTECEHVAGPAVVLERIEPTCEKDGSETTVIKCTLCGIELQRHTRILKAPGHAWSHEEYEEWDVVKEPTCDEPGIEERVCNKCGEVEQREIAALGHDLVDVAEQAPSCYEDGYTAHKACTRCDYTEGKNVIPATHIDEDHDHYCDRCSYWSGPCYDDDNDGFCDWCGAPMDTDCNHVDNDKDHYCDICGEKISECHDCNRDHICDICGETITECMDWNHNHICDICFKILGKCEDKNNDHRCDYCLIRISFCKDADKDHHCDICGLEISCCIDKNRDGYCDICGVDLDWVIRLAGQNRAQTARDAADELKAILGVEKFDAIVYASGYDFPDALAGSYFANQMKAPILLNAYQEAAMNLKYIRENLSKDGVVYILGGTQAMPIEIEEELIASGIKVKRLGGESRFETNLKILDETGFDGGETVLVCTGFEFADSLSASATGMPILLVNNNFTELRDSQVEYLNSLSEKCNFILIGGTLAISEELEAVLTAYDADGTVERVGGQSRYETSLMIAEKFFKNPDQAVLAYGWLFPDALCGGTVAYALNAPVILTSDAKAPAVASYMNKYNITSGYVMGGTMRLSDEVVCVAFSLESVDQIHTR